MKIAYYDYNIEVDFSYGEISNIVIENPMVLDAFVMALHNSLNKKEEKIHVLEDFEEVNFVENTDLIFSPLGLSYERRDVQKRLIQNILEEISESDISYKFSEICSDFLENIQQLEMDSEYEIDFDEDLDMQKLIKCFDIHLQEPAGSFVERLVEYISVMTKLMRKRIFILIGCSDYMDEVEYKLLEKHVAYEHVAVIKIEGRQNALKNLKNQYILDADLCEI